MQNATFPKATHKRGAFSKVTFSECGKFAKITSQDMAKECLVMWGYGESDMWPEIERQYDMETQDSDDQVFVMPKYDQPRSLKAALLPEEWEKYQALRKTPWHMAGYGKFCELYRLAQTLPYGLSDVICEALDSLANYGDTWAIEVSPRNVAVKNGRLILLDIFYDRKALRRNFGMPQ